MSNRVHPEFAFQARELEGQIDGILGDPPNQKNYDLMVKALVAEYAGGGGIEDVNMMAFALVDHIRFGNPKPLLAECRDYEGGDPARVFALASCEGAQPQQMYNQMTANFPELARQAILTAFLHKQQGRWVDDDTSLDQLAAGDDGDEDDEDHPGEATEDFAQLFDQED